jgi:hypothetical protein
MKDKRDKKRNKTKEQRMCFFRDGQVLHKNHGNCIFFQAVLGQANRTCCVGSLGLYPQMSQWPQRAQELQPATLGESRSIHLLVGWLQCV